MNSEAQHFHLLDHASHFESLASPMVPAKSTYPFRPRHGHQLDNWLIGEGCTHTLTLMPDIRIKPGRTADHAFKPMMRRLVKAISQDVRRIRTGDLDKPEALGRVVWMAGFVEFRDMGTFRIPRWHGAVILEKGEERLFRAVLTNRWGKGPDAPALRPVVSRWNCYPDFELGDIEVRGGWMHRRPNWSPFETPILLSHENLVQARPG